MTDAASFALPENFVRTNRETFGEAGGRWLDELPVLLAEFAARWDLTVGPPFAPLSYNYVAPATCADGSPAVLKVGVPRYELLTEIEALRLYGGQGIVRLLDADPERGALLLERLEPGVMLTTVAERDDEEATRIAAGVMRRLWRPAPPAPHPFPSVADWAAGLGKLRARFAGASGPFPAALVDEAETLFDDLLGSMDAPVLLHGDLHHFNILAAERAPWLAIDPKGILGEPAYETSALLGNPDVPAILALPQPGRFLARRIDVLADELGLDRARIRGWGVAQAVLSAWWTIEDNGTGWEPTIALAEHLAAVKV